MFLNRLNEITKPRVHTVMLDLGFGDGEEPIHFRELTFQQRADILTARSKDDGTLDIRDSGRYVGAEIIAASLCDASGKPVASVEAVRSWDAKLTDRLANEAMKVLQQEKIDEDPSKGQS